VPQGRAAGRGGGRGSRHRLRHWHWHWYWQRGRGRSWRRVDDRARIARRACAHALACRRLRGTAFGRAGSPRASSMCAWPLLTASFTPYRGLAARGESGPLSRIGTRLRAGELTSLPHRRRRRPSVVCAGTHRGAPRLRHPRRRYNILTVTSLHADFTTQHSPVRVTYGTSRSNRLTRDAFMEVAKRARADDARTGALTPAHAQAAHSRTLACTRALSLSPSPSVDAHGYRSGGRNGWDSSPHGRGGPVGARADRLPRPDGV
jgi:hypothetical protein